MDKVTWHTFPNRWYSEQTGFCTHVGPRRVKVCVPPAWRYERRCVAFLCRPRRCRCVSSPPLIGSGTHFQGRFIIWNGASVEILSLMLSPSCWPWVHNDAPNVAPRPSSVYPAKHFSPAVYRPYPHCMRATEGVLAYSSTVFHRVCKVCSPVQTFPSFKLCFI